MELLPAFPDIEDIALTLFESEADTALAHPPEITPPLVIVARIGGIDDAITDNPRVQVDCFGATRRATADLAERCRQLVLASPNTGVGAASVDQAWTESAPVYVPYGDLNVHRYVAAYGFALRRTR